jgi:hypothetical protein
MTELKYIELPLLKPQMPATTGLKKSHIKGLNKLGKVIIPDFPGFPSFEELNMEKYLNRMIDYMYDDDRGAILVILSLFSGLPCFVIRWKMQFIDWAAKWKGAPGAAFRMLQIALKGMIFTLYYSDFTEGKVIHEKIGYDAKIVKN